MCWANTIIGDRSEPHTNHTKSLPWITWLLSMEYGVTVLKLTKPCKKQSRQPQTIAKEVERPCLQLPGRTKTAANTKKSSRPGSKVPSFKCFLATRESCCCYLQFEKQELRLPTHAKLEHVLELYSTMINEPYLSFDLCAHGSLGLGH